MGIWDLRQYNLHPDASFSSPLDGFDNLVIGEIGMLYDNTLAAFSMISTVAVRISVALLLLTVSTSAEAGGQGKCFNTLLVKACVHILPRSKTI